MDTRSGELLGSAKPDQPTMEAIQRRLRKVEDEQRADAIEAIQTEHPVVAVPESFFPMTPQMRLAAFFGGSTEHGKDRKASRPRPKSDRERRYERAAARRARQ